MKKQKQYTKYTIVGIIIALVIIGVFLFNDILIGNKSSTPSNLNVKEIPAELLDPNADFSHLNIEFTANENEIMETSSGIKYTIDPDRIRGGGPPKGGIGFDRGIPALDETNIKYISVEDADAWIADNELILFLEHNNVKRVYPLQIMTWHEIANDVLGGDPVVVTYCPLCGSGIAYFRVLNDQPVKFGTSGKLYNSNLVMYDDLTETYWQQIDGNAIVGELTGYELQEISIDTLVWRDFKTSPQSQDAEVLSQNTGISRDYGRDPYGSYYEDSFLIFPVDNEDNRVHPKTVIFGIEINGFYKAYKEDDLIDLNEIEDVIGGVNIKIERDDAGIIKITNLDSGEEIIKERDFWFAWYAFHPDTELYEK